ncbi:hypothetical protein GCM10007853_23630 [Algimonas ampicilliniresistens]|uniref:Uncharacterized protein n=1 Tax=Algimonas ampicilliniresistens TaxID=1298735 RepID=A0ABQ5VBV0_9PROT|nr:hypothetical protein [Algimonas ampicilliniresistens]GLQ24489.1 hypothetical protein GCM10007853_23630 [Algimonas ampicilliniresistens]
MVREVKEIDFKLYGLRHEKDGAVRADVFAKKLADFVNGLKAADKHVNGKKAVNHLITNLEYGSALARISEEVYSRKVSFSASGIEYYQEIANDIATGGPIKPDTPIQVLKSLAALGDGADKTFSHGEMQMPENNDNIVRFDTYFDKQAGVILDKFTKPAREDAFYEGTSFGEFDGTIKEVDLRGKIHSAKLILSAGNVEIDCICNSVSVTNLRETLDRRVIVQAAASYDGTKRLPTRLDIKLITPVATDGDLLRWCGAFDVPPIRDGDLW